MAVNVKNYENYAQIKQRLDDITAAVEDESVSLDDALDMYDEAVRLAMRASELVEVSMPVQQDAEDSSEASTALDANTTSEASV